MKKIAHISDLHFGAENKQISEALFEDITINKPNVIVVSGDLTQRAKTEQFKNAKKYLDRFPSPKIIVPGNHDIPLFDVFMRFFAPLNRYKKIISNNLSPVYYDGEIAVYGINSARSLTWKEGRISVNLMKNLGNKLCSIPDDVIKIVVTHHPFISSPDNDAIKRVERFAKALQVIDTCSIDLLLTGHLHEQYSGNVQPNYPKRVGSTIVSQAGTAISNRVRENPNSYNMIYIDFKNIDISVRVWNGINFIEKETSSYMNKGNAWMVNNKRTQCHQDSLRSR